MYNSQPLCLVLCSLCIIFFSSLALACDYEVVAKTEFGKVGGLKTELGYEFRGVPYAKPPLGSLRFAPPQSPDPWTGIYNATTYPKACPQKSLNFGPWDEDCLYMNIYVPLSPNDDKRRGDCNSGDLFDDDLEVNIFIHGGGFTQGNALNLFNGK